MVAIKYLMITGCAGFIGSNFVRYLLKKNLKYKILGLDNLSYASNINSINEFKKSKVKKLEKSNLIGEALAKRAKEKNISEVYFDRGENKYHGRIKTFADTLRKNGLKF